MADPPLSTTPRVRLVGALAAVLVNVLPIALLSRCSDEAARDEPATLPPLQVSLHDRPAPAGAPARFDIQAPAPSFDIALPELQVEADPVPLPQSPVATAIQAPAAAPRVASARDCWPYRWLLRMSRTIDSALRNPGGGERGTAYVRVSIQRSGYILEAPLIRSSGHPRLDAEARAVMQRIGRFEPLQPGDCPGYDVIVVDQPVRFDRR